MNQYNGLTVRNIWPFALKTVDHRNMKNGTTFENNTNLRLFWHRDTLIMCHIDTFYQTACLCSCRSRHYIKQSAAKHCHFFGTMWWCHSPCNLADVVKLMNHSVSCIIGCFVIRRAEVILCLVCHERKEEWERGQYSSRFREVRARQGSILWQ